MGTRIFFFLLGFGLMVIGCTYMITYLNLLSLGYSFWEYFQYILKRSECLCFGLGFLTSTLAIFVKGGERHDLHL